MLKRMIKRCFRAFGLDLRYFDPLTCEDVRLIKTLSDHGVNLIFDIGANVGQFARFLRTAGYRGRIVSFEPLSSAWNQLADAAKHDSLWEIAPRVAIGDRDGEIDMHIAGNSVSSSALEMLGAHIDAAPYSTYISSERSSLRRLDSLAMTYVDDNSVLFIKIDTQGFESQVLKGAPELLKKAVGLNLEMSFVPLYDGQLLFDELKANLEAKGFGLWAITPVFNDPHSYRLLQCDATFYRV